MPREPHFLLQVVGRARGGPTLGPSWPISGADTVVGRAPDADVIVPDPTVSRRHLRITMGPPAALEVLAVGNGTFVDGREATAGQVLPIPEVGCRLQLGGVLLALVPVGETQPVCEPMEPAPTPAPATAHLSVVWDAGQCRIRAQGRDLGLPGAAARLLGLLAESAGEVVHAWDLHESLGTPHLAPLATAVRRGLAQAVASGHLPEALLRRRVRQATGDAGGDLAALLRALVEARRGHGYVLHLRPEDVSIRHV